MLVRRLDLSVMGMAASAAVICGISASPAFAQTTECAARPPAENNPDCGQHNMMMVGEQAIFASHLPMFDSEHRFQVIMAVDLLDRGRDRDALYATDRARNPKVGMYTVRPAEIFVLKRMFAGQTDRRTSFPGTIFRGHLERGGKPVAGLSGVDVKVRNIVYAREIGGAGAPARPAQLTYVLFGKGTELFLAHQIVRPPDFDQLLRVSVTGRAFTPDELARGVTVGIAGRPDSAARRLRRGEMVAGSASVGSAAAQPVKVTVAAEPYFEEGELATRVTFDPTPLEREAGF